MDGSDIAAKIIIGLIILCAVGWLGYLIWIRCRSRVQAEREIEEDDIDEVDEIIYERDDIDEVPLLEEA